MAKANDILNKAKTFIGLKENPENSNNVIFNTDFYGHAVSGSAYPWCCTFVWYIFKMCNASELFFDGKKTASCTAVLNWGKNRNQIVDLRDGRPGDIILFDWDNTGDADHVGFVLKNNHDGSYDTIEGNTSIGNDSNGGQVMQRTRKSCIRAIIRPNYSKDIEYKVHQQTYGWLPFVDEGECAGYTGRSKRIESVIIESDEYDFSYMVHQQTYGDSKWFHNSEEAGVTGQSKRLEGIAIKCFKKGTNIPVNIEYTVHIQKKGWLPWAKNGEYCGTKGQSLRAEAIKIRFV